MYEMNYPNVTIFNHPLIQHKVAILRDENVDLLHRNGKIYFLDRPLEELLPTSDRPLASSHEAIRHRFEERYERYCTTADCRIDGDGSVEDVAARIRKDFENL